MGIAFVFVFGLQFVADFFLGASGRHADLDLFGPGGLLLARLFFGKLLGGPLFRRGYESDDGGLDGLDGALAGHGPDGDGDGSGGTAREAEPPAEGPEPALREVKDGTLAVVARDDERDDGGQEPEEFFERGGELLTVRVRARVCSAGRFGQRGGEGKGQNSKVRGLTGIVEVLDCLVEFATEASPLAKLVLRAGRCEFGSEFEDVCLLLLLCLGCWCERCIDLCTESRVRLDCEGRRSGETECVRARRGGQIRSRR